jgi:hypothetical protein
MIRSSQLAKRTSTGRAKPAGSVENDPRADIGPCRSPASKRTALDTLFSLNNYALGRRKGAIMDVGGWVRRLGLEQYEATSCRRRTLNDLGVNIVGHRRLLLDAVVAANIRSS